MGATAVLRAAPEVTAPPGDLPAALALFAERRYAEAQPVFEAVLAANPHDTTALLHLGKLAAKRRERELAVDYLGRALAIAPDDPLLNFEYGAACSIHAGTMGTSFKALGAARRGRQAMERAVALEPSNLMFRQGLLEYYAEAPGIAGGSMRKAYEQADAISAIDLNQGAFARANLHRIEGDMMSALQTLAEVIDRSPENYFALYQFGRCSAASGIALERGLSSLQKCLELPAPDKGAPPAYVWWRIGQIQAQLGDKSAARLALLQAQKLLPDDAKLAAEVAELDAVDA